MPKTRPGSVCKARVGISAPEAGLVWLRKLGQAEIENLDAPVFGQENILWLKITMSDALIVRSRESAGHLQSVVGGFARRHRSRLDALAKSFSLQKFRYHVERPFVSADVENRKDVGMI